MAAKGTSRTRKTAREKAEAEPLDIDLTLVVNFGDEPEDAITVLDDQHIMLVGSAFKYRDKAVRFLTYQVLRVGMMQPKVMKEIAPGLMGIMSMARGKTRKSGKAKK